MRFWDTSALVATEVDEKTTSAVRKLVAADPELAVWVSTQIEVASALWRRRRTGEMTELERSEAQLRLDQTLSRAVVISDVFIVAQRARRLLATHPLRVADALQLAAALVACEDLPARLPLVTLDDRLAEAAAREGFTVLP